MSTRRQNRRPARPLASHGRKRFGSRSAPPATQHAVELAELSREVGGTDRDVRHYFLTLPTDKLSAVLERYECEYGRASRERAEVALPSWRSGSSLMSGRMARRLYALLPPLMPTELRFRLVETLWGNLGPRQRRGISAGPDVQIDRLVEDVGDELDSLILRCRIPEPLSVKFPWLATPDVQAKQDLLDHGARLEKSLILDAVKARTPALRAHLAADSGKQTSRLAQVFTIHRHELEVVLETGSTGLRRMSARELRAGERRRSLSAR